MGQLVHVVVFVVIVAAVGCSLVPIERSMISGTLMIAVDKMAWLWPFVEATRPLDTFGQAGRRLFSTRRCP